MVVASFGVHVPISVDQNRINNMVKRVILIGAKLICAAIAIKAYQEPNSFYFTYRMALYCLLMALLMTYYSWDDRLSRLVMLSLSGLCANNLVDELWGDPCTFGTTEYIFGVLIFLNLIYQTFRLWKTKQIK